MTWPTVSLGDLCSPKQWRTISKAKMVTEGYPVYGANGVIGFAEEFTHAEPTIVVGCRGSIGTVHVSAPHAFLTGNCMALDNLRSESIDQRFLALFLAQRSFDDVVSGSSQPQLTRQNIVKIQVPMPPLEEQRRIAYVLDQANRLEARRGHTLNLLDELAQSVFQDMFGDLVSNPRGFAPQQLGDWVGAESPITYGILKPGPDIEDGVPYIRVTDIYRGGIRVDAVKRTTRQIHEEYRRSRLQSGDILISIRGHVGRVGLVPDALDGANITQDTARIRVEPNARRYVSAALSSPAISNWMARRTRGAAVQGINLGDLRLVPLPRPSEAEMALFARRIEEIDRATSISTVQAAAISETVASLRQSFFSTMA